MLVILFVTHGREEAQGGALTERADVDVDRGERGIQVARHRDIIEPGQGYVVRHPEAGLPKRAEGADRHGVVGGEDGRGPSLASEELGGPLESGLLVEVAGNLQLRPCGKPGLPQRRAVAAQPLGGIEVSLRP